MGKEQCHKLHRCKIIGMQMHYRCRHTSLPQYARERFRDRQKRRRYKTSCKLLTAQNYSHKSLKAINTTRVGKSIFDRGLRWMQTEGDSDYVRHMVSLPQVSTPLTTLKCICRTQFPLSFESATAHCSQGMHRPALQKLSCHVGTT